MLAYNARPPQRGFEEGWEEVRSYILILLFYNIHVGAQHTYPDTHQIWMERMKKIPSFFDTWVKKQTKSECNPLFPLFFFFLSLIITFIKIGTMVQFVTIVKILIFPFIRSRYIHQIDNVCIYAHPFF